MNKLPLAAFACLLSLHAWAQESPLPKTYIDTATGRITASAGFVWNGTQWVAAGGSTAQGGSTATPTFTATSPAARTITTLDVKTVTTGGTAVVALTTTHKSAGGFIQNPPTATINLCLNEIGTATGTTSSGDTVCIVPGQTYNLTPSAGAVSVISSDSAHAFSGYGLQ